MKCLRFVTLLVSGVLFLAAWAKLFYPRVAFTLLDRWVGGFELFLAVALLLAYREWRGWVVLLEIFALWAGFSLFWLLRGLPCGCLGNWATPPPGLTFGIDLVFIALSAWAIWCLEPKRVSLALFLSLPTSFFGFLAASLFYHLFFKLL